ncbi:hypothetical protein HK096_005303 [Nowakowskiella sp. JEL0078]|nr:hypothetical protein HK096_005303 [Nowakowskiella sp. JEL0078]
MNLFSEAEYYEKFLKEHERTTRQQKLLQVVNLEIKTIRSCLLEIYEDLLFICMGEVHPQKHYNNTANGVNVSNSDSEPKDLKQLLLTLSEKMWSVIYKRIEELRRMEEMLRGKKEHSSVIFELLEHLRSAMCLYENLIVAAKETWGLNFSFLSVDLFWKDDSEDYDSSWGRNRAIEFVGKCKERLGDIARYQAMFHSDFRKERWNRAKEIYLQVLKLNQMDGLPFAKVGLIASTLNSDFLSLYYYCLSFGNKNAGLLAKENLRVLYKRNAKSEGSTTNSGDLSYVKSLSAWSSDVENLSDYLKKFVIILIITYSDLNTRFSEVDTAGQRQQIRHSQVILLAMLFDISSNSLDIIYANLNNPMTRSFLQTPNSNSSTQELHPVELFLNEPVDLLSPFFNEKKECINPLVRLLEGTGIASVWLMLNLECIPMYRMYVKTVAEKDGEKYLIRRLFKFARSLATTINYLFSIADINGSSECLPEDKDLLGTAILNQYYLQNIDKESLKKVLESKTTWGESWSPGRWEDGEGFVLQRVARFSELAGKMSEDDKCEFFQFDSNAGKFIVADEQTKWNKMKMMGHERLKEVVNILETKVKESRVPIIVVGPECFIENLRDIKDWLTSSCCIVVVAIDVLNFLDLEKEGTESHNVRAREATRFLKKRLKYPTEFIRLQQPSEHLEMWDKSGRLTKITSKTQPITLLTNNTTPSMKITTDSGYSTNSGGGEIEEPIPLPEEIVIHKDFRPILGCYLHFQRNSPTWTNSHNDIAMDTVLVSNNKKLKKVALGLGVTWSSVKNWNDILKSRSKELRLKRRR